MNCRKCRKVIPDESTFCMYCGTRQAVAGRHNVKHRGNGQGSVYKLPNGKYKAVVTLGYVLDCDGSRRRRIASRIFEKKSDAIAALPLLKNRPEMAKDITLSGLYNIYINGKDYDKLGNSQRQKLQYAWARLKPLELRGIATLTVDDMQSVIDAAVSTYYPARDMKVCLSHLYKIAIKKEIVSINKTDYIELPDAPHAKRECWTGDEIEAFWEDYKTHPFTAYILIMCYAGLRYGELAKLPLENIHLDQDYMIGGIKTEAGIDREIPIHHRIKPLIKEIIPTKRNRLLEMNEDTFYAKYWEMISRTGVRELPPQTCRHFYFSAMTAAGIQGGIIAEAGGHASYLTTMKNYVRIPLADKLAAVNAIK